MWAVEILFIEILREVSLMSIHFTLTQEGHLEQVPHTFG